MAHKKKALNKSSSFKGDVITLASATLVGQVLTGLSAPFLARLFSPEAFGISALVIALTSVIASASLIQYGHAIMLPERDEDAANLFTGTIGITLLTSLLLFPILWIIGPWVSNILKVPELTSYLWMIPLLVFFGGFGTGHLVVGAWAGRTRRFAELATSKIWGSVATTLGKVAAGFGGFTSAGGLITGSALGSVLMPLLLGWQIWKKDRALLRENLGVPALLRNLSRYRKFAIYNIPSAGLNGLSAQAPSFLLAAFFSPAVVGFYAFGYQLLNIPMQLIGASISQAFYPHATAASRKQELATFVETTFRRLIEYSLFPSLMLMLSGKEIFTVVFGSQWAEAGIYAQILSLWLLFWFLSMPLSQLINVLEKNEFYFRWNLVTLITRVISIWLGARLGSPLLAITFFSVSGVAIYAYINYWVSVKAGVPWSKIGAMLLQNLAVFIPAGGIVLLLKILRLPDLLVSGTAVLLCAAYIIFRAKDEPLFQVYVGRVRGWITK